MIETITKKINYLIPESILFDSIEYDAEEKFVIIKSLKYLKIHLKRYFIINDAMIGILCWTLGTDSVFICGFLLNFLNRKFKSKFTYKLRNCSSISEDYPDILLDIMKKIPSQIYRFHRINYFIWVLFVQVYFLIGFRKSRGYHFVTPVQAYSPIIVQCVRNVILGPMSVFPTWLAFSKNVPFKIRAKSFISLI